MQTRKFINGFCYPKAKTTQFTGEINRDRGWQILGEMNYEPVRQISLDTDWSALRFRKTEYIKKITHRESFALSKEGKNRTPQKGI